MEAVTILYLAYGYYLKKGDDKMREMVGLKWNELSEVQPFEYNFNR